MDKKTITGWSIAVTWSDGKRENILDIPDEVAQYIDDYLTEIEEHGDLAKPSTELVREIQNDSKLQAPSNKLQAPGNKLQAPSSKLDKKK